MSKTVRIKTGTWEEAFNLLQLSYTFTIRETDNLLLTQKQWLYRNIICTITATLIIKKDAHSQALKELIRFIEARNSMAGLGGIFLTLLLDNIRTNASPADTQAALAAFAKYDRTIAKNGGAGPIVVYDFPTATAIRLSRAQSIDLMKGKLDLGPGYEAVWQNLKTGAFWSIWNPYKINMPKVIGSVKFDPKLIEKLKPKLGNLLKPGGSSSSSSAPGKKGSNGTFNEDPAPVPPQSLFSLAEIHVFSAPSEEERKKEAERKKKEGEDWDLAMNLIGDAYGLGAAGVFVAAAAGVVVAPEVAAAASLAALFSVAFLAAPHIRQAWEKFTNKEVQVTQPTVPTCPTDTSSLWVPDDVEDQGPQPAGPPSKEGGGNAGPPKNENKTPGDGFGGGFSPQFDKDFLDRLKEKGSFGGGIIDVVNKGGNSGSGQPKPPPGNTKPPPPPPAADPVPPPAPAPQPSGSSGTKSGGTKGNKPPGGKKDKGGGGGPPKSEKPTPEPRPSGGKEFGDLVAGSGRGEQRANEQASLGESDLDNSASGDTCFVRGTKVWLGDGSIREIQDLCVGDKVLGLRLDEHLSPGQLKTGPFAIVGLQQGWTNALLQVEVNVLDLGTGVPHTELLICTPNHRFAVRGTDSAIHWTCASKLCASDQLISAHEGLDIETRIVQTLPFIKPSSLMPMAGQVVHNFQVDEAQNYFVGERARVLVHNKKTKEQVGPDDDDRLIPA